MKQSLDHPLAPIIAVSTLAILLMGGLVWRPWPGWSWWLLAGSHAWLIKCLTPGVQPQKVPFAAVALAASCTFGVAAGHGVSGLASALGTGWGLGLCVWLVSLQALAYTLVPIDVDPGFTEKKF